MNWDEVRQEIASTVVSSGRGRNGTPPSKHDVVRRKKIAAVEQITGIPLIIYAVDFVNGGRAAQYGPVLQIELEDKSGLMQALSGIPDGPLDVLIHSPGGSATATESIVHLIRSRFDPVRFIVPHTAKSAATMLALSGNEILLGEAAELGPTDPQLRIVHNQVPVTVPAGAAITQFGQIHRAVTERPDAIRGWLPILTLYGPSFLQECQNAINLSKTLVTDWLQRYMFRGEENAEMRAGKVATWLSDHNNFNSHSRPIWMEGMLEVEPGLKIKRLRDCGQNFDNAIMELYWAIEITFSDTAAFKIIEHREGNAYIGLQQIISVPSASIPGKSAAARLQKKPKRRR